MKLSTEDLPGGTQVLGGGHICATHIPAHLSPQGTGQQVGTDSCMVWAPRGVRTLHWAQDELCYRNTTCLLHFLLKQDTLHPPDQSAQHGSREEVPGTRRPHPGWPFRGGGCGHILGPWAQLPPVLLWGDKHVVSEGLGASFHSLTWSASLQCMVFCAHLAKLSFCCSEPQGSHLTQGSLWNCIICTLS